MYNFTANARYWLAPHQCPVPGGAFLFPYYSCRVSRFKSCLNQLIQQERLRLLLMDRRFLESAVKRERYAEIDEPCDFMWNVELLVVFQRSINSHRKSSLNKKSVKITLEVDTARSVRFEVAFGISGVYYKKCKLDKKYTLMIR